MGHDVSTSLEVGGSVRALEMALKKRSYKGQPLDITQIKGCSIVQMNTRRS